MGRQNKGFVCIFTISRDKVLSESYPAVLVGGNQWLNSIRIPMKTMNLKDLLHNVTTQLRDLSPLDKPDFRLEQAVYKKDDKVWEIVVSYLVENNNKPNNPFLPLVPQPPYQRVYKKVIMDENGQVAEFLMYDMAG